MNIDDLKSRYTIPPPDTPISLYALTLALIAGLIALYIAAFHAFSQVMQPMQASFNAALIEIGAVVEAIALVRGRNKIALLALVLSIIVSATYNYIQVSTAGAALGLTNDWQLLTLALGPLLALTFLALTTGGELAAHEQRKAEWHADRQTWLEKEIAREQRREGRARQNYREVPGKFPTPEGGKKREKSPVLVTPIYTDFRQIPPELYPKIAAMSTREIRQTFRLSEPKTAYNWQQNAKKVTANGHIEIG